MKAVIALGANLGNREDTFRRACCEIEKRIAKIDRASCWYETRALVHPESTLKNQPDYLNGAILLNTSSKPEDVLHDILSVEEALGRKREEEKEPWSSRILDLDLICMDELVISKPNLLLPHPRMHEREFVLLPVSEILPDWRHPVLGMNVLEMLGELGR